jgi:predicted TIM-barrel fold metal-dependent hydrolase
VSPVTDDIALFDSHGSATLDGTWLDGRAGLTLPALREAMTAAGFLGGLVQGLHGVGGYDHQRFADAARKLERLWPVAAWDGSDADSSEGHVAELKALGFAGVHVHPRAAGGGPDTPQFRSLLRATAKAGLPVFFCTYQFAHVDAGLPVDPLPHLAEALRAAPAARLVLLHGGTVEVLRYAEFTRANPRVLLDLSFTMMRYAGALDAQLDYVLRTLDRRVCIGSDAPEYAPAEVRARFEALTAHLPLNKRLNIAGRSLARFLGLDLYPPGE